MDANASAQGFARCRDETITAKDKGEIGIKNESDLSRTYGLKTVKIILSRIDSENQVLEFARLSSSASSAEVKVNPTAKFSDAKSGMKDSTLFLDQPEKKEDSLHVKQELNESENAAHGDGEEASEGINYDSLKCEEEALDIPFKMEEENDLLNFNSNNFGPSNVKVEMAIEEGSHIDQMGGQDELSMNRIGDTLFQYNFCRKTYKLKSSLARHMKIHYGREQFDCNECRKSFKWRKSLVTHLKIHSESKIFDCTECGKSFTRRDCLASHLKIHSGREQFDCNECRKSFKWRKSLVTHLKVHSESKIFDCTECGKSMNCERSLVSHLKIHTEEKPYVCSICGKGFSQKSSMVRHGKTHSGPKDFECTDCRIVFILKSHLVNHLKFHSGENPHECPICRKSFCDEEKMMRHVKIHYNVEKFNCNECGNSFNAKWHLSRHMLTHTGEKPHACLCGMRFRQSIQLKRHFKTHSGREEYDWEGPLKPESGPVGDSEIGETAHGLENLGRVAHGISRSKQHVQIERKNFDCVVCGKSFSYRCYLERHLKNHSDLKPHKCYICGMRFREKHNMKKHVILHSGRKDFPCTECGQSLTANPTKPHLTLRALNFDAILSLKCEKQQRASHQPFSTQFFT